MSRSLGTGLVEINICISNMQPKTRGMKNVYFRRFVAFLVQEKMSEVLSVFK